MTSPHLELTLSIRPNQNRSIIDIQGTAADLNQLRAIPETTGTTVKSKITPQSRSWILAATGCQTWADLVQEVASGRISKVTLQSITANAQNQPAAATVNTVPTIGATVDPNQTGVTATVVTAPTAPTTVPTTPPATMGQIGSNGQNTVPAPNPGPVQTLSPAQIQAMIRSAVKQETKAQQDQIAELKQELNRSNGMVEKLEAAQDPFLQDLRRYKAITPGTPNIYEIATTIQGKSYDQNSLARATQIGWINVLRSLGSQHESPERLHDALFVLLAIQLRHWNTDFQDLIPGVVLPEPPKPFFRKGRNRKAAQKRTTHHSNESPPEKGT